MPRLEKILDGLSDLVVFSKIDLQFGFHQIHIKEGNESKIAFQARFGHYHFLVMPFGLTNAPATFQLLMTSILKTYLGKFAEVWIDNILIFNTSIEEHK